MVGKLEITGHVMPCKEHPWDLHGRCLVGDLDSLAQVLEEFEHLECGSCSLGANTDLTKADGRDEQWQQAVCRQRIKAMSLSGLPLPHTSSSTHQEAATRDHPATKRLAHH